MGNKTSGILFFFLCILLVSSCATSQQTYQGAAGGGALGAAAGALIDKDNSWRGAVIGGALGATLGATLTEISTRAAREAAQADRPVIYQSNDGWQRVEASPVEYNARTKCHKVREKEENMSPKALGISALVVAILGIFVPVVTIYVVWFSLALAATGAFMGDKVFPIVALVANLINLVFTNT